MLGIAMMGLLPMLMDPGMAGMMQSMMMMSMGQGGGQLSTGGVTPADMQALLQDKLAGMVQQIPGLSNIASVLQDIRGGASLPSALIQQLPPEAQEKARAAQEILNILQGKDSVLQDKAAEMLQKIQGKINAVVEQAVGNVQEKIDTTIQKATTSLDTVITKPEAMLAAVADKVREVSNKAEAALEQGTMVVATEVDRVAQAVISAQQALQAGMQTYAEAQQNVAKALNDVITAPSNVVKKIASQNDVKVHVANILGVIADMSAQLEAAQNLEKQRLKDIRDQLNQTKELSQKALADTATAAVNTAKTIAAEQFLEQMKKQEVVVQRTAETIKKMQETVGSNISKTIASVQEQVNTNIEQATTQLEALAAQPEQVLVSLVSTVNDLAQDAQQKVAQGIQQTVSINQTIAAMQNAVAAGTKTALGAQQEVAETIAKAITAPANTLAKIRKDKTVRQYVDNLLGVVETLSTQLQEAQAVASKQIEATKKEFQDTEDMLQDAIKETAASAANVVSAVVASVAMPFIAQAIEDKQQQEAATQAADQAKKLTEQQQQEFEQQQRQQATVEQQQAYYQEPIQQQEPEQAPVQQSAGLQPNERANLDNISPESVADIRARLAEWSAQQRIASDNAQQELQQPYEQQQQQYFYDPVYPQQ